MGAGEQQPHEFMLFKGQRRLPVCLIGLPNGGEHLTRLYEVLRVLAPLSNGPSPVDVTVICGGAPQPVRLCTRRLLVEANEAFAEITPDGYRYFMTPEAFLHFYRDLRWPTERCSIDVLVEYLIGLSVFLAHETMLFLVLGDLPAEEYDELRQRLGSRNVYSEKNFTEMTARLRKEAEMPHNANPSITQLPEAIQLGMAFPDAAMASSHSAIVGALAVSNSLYLPFPFEEPTQVELQFLRDEHGDCYAQQGFPMVYSENERWSVIDLDKEIFFGRVFRGEIHMGGQSVQFVGSAGNCLPPVARPVQTDNSAFKGRAVIATILLAVALLAGGGWFVYLAKQRSVPMKPPPEGGKQPLTTPSPETTNGSRRNDATPPKGEAAQAAVPQSFETASPPKDEESAVVSKPLVESSGHTSVNDDIANFNNIAKANATSKSASVDLNDEASVAKKPGEEAISAGSSEDVTSSAASEKTPAGGTVELPSNASTSDGAQMPTSIQPTTYPRTTPPAVSFSDTPPLERWNVNQVSGEYSIRSQRDVEKLQDILRRRSKVKLVLRFDEAAGHELRTKVRNLLAQPRENWVEITLQ